MWMSNCVQAQTILLASLNDCNRLNSLQKIYESPFAILSSCMFQEIKFTKAQLRKNCSLTLSKEGGAKCCIVDCFHCNERNLFTFHQFRKVYNMLGFNIEYCIMTLIFSIRNYDIYSKYLNNFYFISIGFEHHLLLSA